MSTLDCRGPDGTCECVASDVLELLGTKYAMDVLCVIGSHEPVRFSTIEEHVPEASTSTLSARLDEFEAAGLLVRERYDEIPPRVEYELSANGRELGERLRPVFDWVAESEVGKESDGPGRAGGSGSPSDRGGPDRGRGPHGQ